jgi:hypothetical protein
MTDPLGERAAVVFVADLAADRLPSVRAIRAALHVGQPRAQRLRGHLAAAAETHGETSPRDLYLSAAYDGLQSVREIP